MESQLMEMVAKDGIWALMFVFLLFYVLNILSKKIDEIILALKENTEMLYDLKSTIQESSERKNLK